MLQGTFQYMNTLTREYTGISSLQSQKPPITYSNKGQKKRTHPQSIMSANSGRSGKPFDLRNEDVDEPINKRLKQGRSTKIQDPIEVISDASDKSDHQVAPSPMALSLSGSSFTAQTGKSKNTSRTRGRGSYGIKEYQRVEDTIRVNKPNPVSRRRRNSESSIDLGAEEISSTDTSSPRPSERQQRSVELGADVRGSKMSETNDYRGTANQRLSRRQEERLKGLTNGRVPHQAPRQTRPQTKSPYFPQKDRSKSKPVESGMKGKGVTSDTQELMILSSRHKDVRQAPQQTAGAIPSSVVLDRSDGPYTSEPLRASTGPAQKYIELQPLGSGKRLSASNGDDMVIPLSSDSLGRERNPMAKPEMDSSAPDSVATVGNITSTTFTRRGSKGIAIVNATRNIRTSPNPRYKIKDLDIFTENRNFSGSNAQSGKRTNSFIAIDRISDGLKLFDYDFTANQEEEKQIVPLSSIFKIDYSPLGLLSSCGVVLNARCTVGRQSWIWIEFVNYEDLEEFLEYFRSTASKVNIELRKMSVHS